MEAGPHVRITIDQLATLIRNLTGGDYVDFIQRYRFGSTAKAAASASVGNVVAVKVAPANANRIAITLGTPQTASVFVAFNSPNLLTGEGMLLLTTNDPVMLTYDQIGYAITGDIWAIAGGVAAVLPFQEFEAPMQLA